MHLAARPAGGLGDVAAAGQVECADSEVAYSLNLIFNLSCVILAGQDLGVRAAMPRSMAAGRSERRST
jgi:hypothetical protein